MRAKSATPNSSVHIAPQRKKNKARRMSGGLTAGFISLASPPWKGRLTKLKKYRWPIQTTPATMWNQRKMAWRADSMSGMDGAPSVATAADPAACGGKTPMIVEAGEGLSRMEEIPREPFHLCLTAPKTATYGVGGDGETQGL